KPTTGATNTPDDSNEVINIGFVAVGPEGAWRDANEANVQETFTKDKGYNLTYSPAASPTDQASQIAAFDAFINQEVDIILLSATEASGWADSLQRAKEA